MNAPQSAAQLEPYVLRSLDGGVLRLTLNRPKKMNVLSDEMLVALQAEVDAAAQDEAVRVVVIAGAGRAFCAGHDLRQMRANADMAYLQRLFRDCTKLMLSLQRLPQPVVARVHGIATAAGCQLVSMCDLAVAADDATFGINGINVGLACSTPSVGLTRNIGRKDAFEMLVTGEFIDARAAHQRGLVNRVVPAADLDAEVGRLLEPILAKPRRIVALGKQLFYRQLDMGIDAAYQLAGQTMACNMLDPLTLEGVDAFVEKRAPRW